MEIGDEIDPLSTNVSMDDILKETDFSMHMHHLAKEMNKMQERVLLDVLRQALGREPELEDAKLLTIIRYPGDIMDYTLALWGREIGRMEFNQEFSDGGAKWTVTFKPI